MYYIYSARNTNFKKMYAVEGTPTTINLLMLTLGWFYLFRGTIVYNAKLLNSHFLMD